MDWMCIWGEKKGEWKQGESICCSNLEILNLFVDLIWFPLNDMGGAGGVGDWCGCSENLEWVCGFRSLYTWHKLTAGKVAGAYGPVYLFNALNRERIISYVCWSVLNTCRNAQCVKKGQVLEVEVVVSEGTNYCLNQQGEAGRGTQWEHMN